jgi:hypothetical protein
MMIARCRTRNRRIKKKRRYEKWLKAKILASIASGGKDIRK